MSARTLADAVSAAEAAVAATARRFVDTHLPHAERLALARQHEANLAALAQARSALADAQAVQDQIGGAV